MQDNLVAVCIATLLNKGKESLSHAGQCWQHSTHHSSPVRCKQVLRTHTEKHHRQGQQSSRADCSRFSSRLHVLLDQHSCRADHDSARPQPASPHDRSQKLHWPAWLDCTVQRLRKPLYLALQLMPKLPRLTPDFTDIKLLVCPVLAFIGVPAHYLCAVCLLTCPAYLVVAFADVLKPTYCAISYDAT